MATLLTIVATGLGLAFKLGGDAQLIRSDVDRLAVAVMQLTNYHEQALTERRTLSERIVRIETTLERNR